MKKRKNAIPITNYVKLAFIICVTVFVCFVVRNWYVSNRDYELNIPIIRDALISEINADEIYNYIRENENAIIYVGTSNSEACREFEKVFKKIVQERNLESLITYLNITKLKNQSKFLNEFNKFYNTKLLGYPSFIIFEEGEVKAILTVKTGEHLSVESVVQFLDDNEIAFDMYD